MRNVIVASDSVLSDEEIVDRVRGGEIALYEVLMRRHNERLYRAVLGILKNEGEVEEVMQEAYVRAYTHLNQFEGHSTFATWLTRIAIHEAFGRIRLRKRFVDLPDNGEGENAMERIPSKKNGPEVEYLRRQMRDLLEDWIGRLPEKYRLVFMLREVDGMSTRETAECLGIDEEAVKTRLFRARAMLRRKFEARSLDAVRELFHFGGERCNRVVAAVMERIHTHSDGF
jgi:RNA polymerase sigma-70 factor, ECF subfamily